MKKKVDPYQNIASQYDLLIGRREEIRFLRRIVKQSHPKAKNILELACGTGTLLKSFSNNYQIYGADISKPMLTIAKSVLPSATFYNLDMTKFKIKQKFDIILCLFNSLNHLSNFNEWKQTFRQVKKHLSPSGIFIFDINTPLSLENYFIDPPRIEVNDNHILTTEFSRISKGTLLMHARIFTRIKNNTYQLKEGKIIEKAYPTNSVLRELKKHFSSIRVLDPDRKSHSIKSEELYFICGI